MKEVNTHKEDKADAIISVAQKRFAIYGAAKTSMREIADDLHLSKASLYYYFPDKENLYRAVIEKEQCEFLKTLEKDVSDNPEPAECLRSYAVNRLSYFRKLVNLGRIIPSGVSEFGPAITESFRNFREEEKRIIMKVLEKGSKTGEFRIEDTYKTASLYLEILRGLRGVFLRNNVFDPINEEEFDELTDRISQAADIFIKGLKYKE